MNETGKHNVEEPLLNHKEIINGENKSIEEENQLLYQHAAIYVSDALNTRSDVQTLKDTHIHDMHLKVFFLAHNRWYRRLVYLFIFLQLSLSYFERPSYRSPHVKGHFLILTTELVCTFVYILDTSLRYYYQGKEKFLSDRWNTAKMIAIFLVFVDLILGYMLLTRVFRCFRGFFVIEKSKLLRSHFQNVGKAMANVTTVLLFLSFVIFFYSFLGLALFHETKEGDMYFSNIEDGFVNLFILMTTANYPDVMMPAYSEHKAYCLFFISYLCFSLYFLTNLLLAIIYNYYKDQARSEIVNSLKFRQRALARAFKVLNFNHDGTMNRNVFFKLMKTIRPKYTDDEIALMFKLLDRNDRGFLSLNNFQEVCDILQINFVPTIPGLNAFEQRNIRFKLKMLILSKPFRYWVNALIFGTAFLVFLASTEVGYRNVFVFINRAMWVVSILFLIELGLLIFSMGWNEFIKSSWHVVDGVFIILGFVGVVLSNTISGIYNMDERYLVFVFWSVNVLRVMFVTESFRRIILAFFDSLPALSSFVGILVVVYYFFATGGMEIYWGRLDRGNPLLVNTTYDTADYYANNFDSILTAMVTLFELMVVNNWFIIMDGVVAVTNRWSRLYFIAFYVVIVFVVINLIVAFIIEAFILKYEQTNVRDNQLSLWRERVRQASDNLGGSKQWDVIFRPKIGEFYRQLYVEDSQDADLEFYAQKKSLYEGVCTLIRDYHLRGTQSRDAKNEGKLLNYMLDRDDT